MQKVFLLLIVSTLLLSLVLAQSSAKPDVIQQLLDLPAPPPKEPADEEEPPDLTSYDETHPPPDDAPIAVLDAYWRDSNLSGEKEMPDQIRLRFLTEAEKNPAELPSYLDADFIPDTPEVHARVKAMLDHPPSFTAITDSEEEAQGRAEQWKTTVQEWLTLRSKYFLDDLAQAAQTVVEKETEIEGERYLAALSKLDWDRVQPMLAMHVTGFRPRLAAFALTLQYRHAMTTNDNAESEKVRTRLRAIVSDKLAPTKARDLACEALVESEWGGRDEWFVSLFADESLRAPKEGEYQNYHPLRNAAQLNLDHWLPVIAKLVGHSNRIVHDTAVETLVSLNKQELCKEALLPLLPWLTNHQWSSAKKRDELIEGLGVVQLPEALPALIELVDREGNTPAKPSARSSLKKKQQEEDEYDFESDVSAAIDTLGEYKDARAIPTLKRALLRTSEKDERERIIKALHACGGLTDDEIVKGIEAFAVQAIATGKSLDELLARIRNDYFEFQQGQQPSISASIGQVLMRDTEPREVWAAKLLTRINVLRKAQPGVARLMLSFVQPWQLRVVDAAIVQHIGEGKADINEIDDALEQRKRLAKSVGDDLQRLVSKGGAAAGIAAVLLDDSSSQRAILQERDLEAIRALLAAARRVRTPLPIGLVSQHLINPALSLAAERYLESEDSAEARALVLARHPGKARILGAHWDFDPSPDGNGYYARDMIPLEKKLQQEVLRKDGPTEIIALLRPERWGRPEGDLIIRCRSDKAELTWTKDDAREESRWLEPHELPELRAFIAENAIENLPPLLRPGHHGSHVYEYLRITKDGGRRVFVVTSYVPKSSKKSHFQIVYQFNKLTEGKSFKLRYALADRLKDLEVLYANDHTPIQNVWQEGDDLRVLIAGESQNDATWHVLTAGRIGEPVTTPALYAAAKKTAIPAELRRESIWTQAIGEEIVYQTYSYKAEKMGLMKVLPGNHPTLLIEGRFSYPLLTPDGKWLLASKSGEDRTDESFMRVDLQAGKEYRLNLPPDARYEPITYVPLHEKILLRQRKEKSDSIYYFVNPQNGAIEVVKGEVAPLTQIGSRFLQPTRNRDEFWAAIYNEKNKVTEIGRYNLRTFAFTPTQSIPELKFDSMQLWVDEAKQCIYVVYNGHLLRLPLQR